VESRAAELRRRDGRVLRWSLAAAALVHVAAFVLWPSFRIEPFPGLSEATAQDGGGEGTPIWVEAVFGPPEISLGDGRVHREDRQLEASRVLLLPPECSVLGQGDGSRPHGRVHLRVWKSGRTDVLAITESTGSDCGDEVISAMAGALWYRWLPNDRFQAPVDLVQPVTLVPASD